MIVPQFHITGVKRTVQRGWKKRGKKNILPVISASMNNRAVRVPRVYRSSKTRINTCRYMCPRGERFSIIARSAEDGGVLARTDKNGDERESVASASSLIARFTKATEPV